ncbi:hypothetical protein [Clostridium aquiflavi]|uniref:Uncharacterized protein n=1 Tax=Clostridium aquiflavi TaxID=3073603 RepID=A0ABU1EE33_9CLOT|nr:hypothetical protein [Clostridium sp. 5N-1]MDR5586638.1 hypothetical protein [Clostridium sp. 5N-1]
MSKFLWINPVAEKMYGKDINTIEEALIKKGYVLVSCESQLDYVKKQYKSYAEKNKNTILDCRCPQTIKVLKEYELTDGYDVPDIEPILIRTSRVLYDKYISKENDSLIITCPCTQLRDFTAKKLEDKKEIIVLTWKEFIESEEMKSLGKIKASPIPLGFFDNTFENVLKLSNEDMIISAIKKNQKKYDIIEMLYCKDGCNNGDGL